MSGAVDAFRRAMEAASSDTTSREVVADTVDYLRSHGFTVHYPGTGCQVAGSDRPLARTADPGTSQAAARVGARQRVRKPGTVAHQVLIAYGHAGAYGLTAREVEAVHRVRNPWRRVSDLLADGCLEAVLTAGLVDGSTADPPLVDAVRDGSRVLAITGYGRSELHRLQTAWHL